MTTPPLVAQAMDNQPGQPGQPQKPRGSWFGRNWGKLLGCGCFGVLLGGVGFVVLIYSIVIASMKGSGAYAKAMEKMGKSPSITAEIGAPIETGWLFTGSINTSTTGGRANFYYPISGPNGSGKVHVVAYKTSGDWTITTLTVDLDKTKKQLDILAEVPDEPEK